jgi:riboflavin synthase
MFTGIVEEVGKVTTIETSGGTRKITVTSKHLSKELKLGDSIAVSGVCLTAVRIKPGNSFGADLADETWQRTSFSRISKDAEVNLELPMKADGRFGGHVVQGHVDGTGKFMGLEPIAGAQDYWLHIEVPANMTKYIVYKGSISVEGISLTVAKIEGQHLTIAIIPHTTEMTNLKSLKPGDPVNLETDIIAKYVEKMMSGERVQGALDLDALVSQGF